MTVRIGIVGAGMIAAIHRDAIAALPGAQLTGIMDRGSGRGAALAPGPAGTTEQQGNELSQERFLNARE